MDIFLHSLFDLLSFVGTLFWIAMLIDCFRNPNMQGRNRTGWVLFIVFTHWVGATVYFFVLRPTWPMAAFTYIKNRLFAPQMPMSGPQPKPTYTSPTPTYTPPPYQDYREGYQAHSFPASYTPISQEEHSTPSYEQPQAAYPEMPPQQ